MMAYAMAAEASKHVAAISSVSGQVELPTIHPTRAVPTMEFRSLNDPIAEWDGVPNRNPHLPIGRRDGHTGDVHPLPLWGRGCPVVVHGVGMHLAGQHAHYRATSNWILAGSGEGSCRSAPMRRCGSSSGTTRSRLAPRPEHRDCTRVQRDSGIEELKPNDRCRQ
jgi:hypothetical protein